MRGYLFEQGSGRCARLAREIGTMRLSREPKPVSDGSRSCGERRTGDRSDRITAELGPL